MHEHVNFKKKSVEEKCTLWQKKYLMDLSYAIKNAQYVGTLLLHFGTRAYLFSSEEGSCYVFSTRNNCKFFASDGVIFQSVIKP